MKMIARKASPADNMTLPPPADEPDAVKLARLRAAVLAARDDIRAGNGAELDLQALKKQLHSAMARNDRSLVG